MPASVVPVLMYHHVSPTPGLITVSPQHFAAQMRWLKRQGYTTLKLDALAGFLAGEPVPAVLLGEAAAKRIPVKWVHGCAALLFAVLGVVVLSGVQLGFMG